MANTNDTLETNYFHSVLKYQYFKIDPYYLEYSKVGLLRITDNTIKQGIGYSSWAVAEKINK